MQHRQEGANNLSALKTTWRTQKIFTGGGFHSVADGGHLCFLCAVCDKFDVIFMFSSEVC